MNSTTEHPFVQDYKDKYYVLISMSDLFLRFFGCENYTSRCFFSIFLPLKWGCERYMDFYGYTF